jgi:deazaflavin-dependent oxidoreductase (nitroreductase family)
MASLYLEPGFVLSRLVNPVLMKFGLCTTLAVRGRRSGEWRTVPVNVLEFDGERYLVAPRGDTHWARNLRAAGGGELRTRKGAEPFKAVEVPDAEKPPLIEAYLARWGTQVKSQFKALPDPADHPVFRLER